VDEIDAVRSLPFSTDEFFAAIRECYNRRTTDPAYERLTFCRLGERDKAEDYYAKALKWWEGQSGLPPNWVGELNAFRAEAEAVLGKRKP